MYRGLQADPVSTQPAVSSHRVAQSCKPRGDTSLTLRRHMPTTRAGRRSTPPAGSVGQSNTLPAMQVNVLLSASPFKENPGLALLLCRLWRAAAAPATTAAAAAGLSLDFSNLSDGGPQGDPGELCPVRGVAVQLGGWSGCLPGFVEEVFDALGDLCGRLGDVEAAADVGEATLAAAGYGRHENGGPAAGPDSVGIEKGEGGGVRVWELGQQCVRLEEGALAAEVRGLLVLSSQAATRSMLCAVAGDADMHGAPAAVLSSDHICSELCPGLHAVHLVHGMIYQAW